ncbi:MAG: Asparagine synthetase [Rhizobium sp.]|nr:Asparagine synthetase [Rhizobium sp.]
MSGDNGRFVITFNGEIFNHVELRRDLEAQGHRFRTSTDTEVIPHLFERFGERCLSKLNGDFALAIWDTVRERMFLARDRMGVRPLFYTRHRGTVYFASEVKALLKVPGLEATLDIKALDQIFTPWAFHW